MAFVRLDLLRAVHIFSYASDTTMKAIYRPNLQNNYIWLKRHQDLHCKSWCSFIQAEKQKRSVIEYFSNAVNVMFLH